ncbi:hypothetical protein BKA93DRAFT_797774 [Sparassis latifolia]
MPLPEPVPTAYSSENCGICLENLHVPSRNEVGTSYIIDDVQLHCGPPDSGPGPHHFHWICLLEWAKSDGDWSRCPLCRQNTLDRNGTFVVEVRNEGGVTGGVDMGDVIDEEIYMDAHPQERYEEAFLSCMAMSEHEDAETLLTERSVNVNCTYKPGGQTALHMAAINGDMDGIRFLLGHGADRNFRDDAGMTPLDFARQGEADSAEAVAFLSAF